MSESLRLMLVFALAAIPAFALCRGVMALKLMDAPTEARKIQKAPVPTSGGVGVALAAIIAVLGVTALTHLELGQAAVAIGAASLAMTLLGLVDDQLRLPALVKLVAMLAICIGVVVYGVRAETLQAWPGAVKDLSLIGACIGSVMWLAVVVNAVNFMDGANGLSMGMALIAAVGLAACAALAGAWDIALLTAALAGGLAGFLVWNIPGKLFVGDAGALGTGMLLGGVSLALVKLRPDWLFVPAIVMLPWLTDVLLTLAWRARHRKPLFSAHRDHVYQIAMKAGLKHWQVAAIHAVWAVNATGMGVMSAIAGGYVPVAAFLTLLVASSWVHLRVRRSGVRAGLVGAQIP